MSLLYKNPKDIVYSVEIKSTPDGKINFEFSCDGGKHGTDEPIDEYTLTVLELLKILQANSEPDQIE